MVHSYRRLFLFQSYRILLPTQFSSSSTGGPQWFHSSSSRRTLCLALFDRSLKLDLLEVYLIVGFFLLMKYAVVMRMMSMSKGGVCVSGTGCVMVIGTAL